MQSKGWKTPIGPAVVREILGAKQLHEFSEAWVISVNGATSGAMDAAKWGSVRILTAQTLAHMAGTGTDAQ